MLRRHIQNLEKFVEPNKVLVVQGPRQVGKTTLVKNYLSSLPDDYNYVYLTGDSIEAREVFSSLSIKDITEFAQGKQLIVIDEAQKIDNIGLGIKILVDNVERIRVIITGSSSFQLRQQMGEPLVGRAISLKLFPIAVSELQGNGANEYELNQSLNDYLTYGFYPDILLSKGKDQKKAKLEELVDRYLLKDILEFERVKGSKFILDLLRLLAFQIGQLVSVNELANKLNVNARTVSRYLDLLEQSYILINIRGYRRNLRAEVNKKSKYYFYDVGIRNAIINNYNNPDLRDDIGGLWENFLVVERLKRQAYEPIYSNNYFWRTWEKQEVDWVEERDGKLDGSEIKWGQNTKKQLKFTQTYPEAKLEIINKKNYLKWITII